MTLHLTEACSSYEAGHFFRLPDLYVGKQGG